MYYYHLDQYGSEEEYMLARMESQLDLEREAELEREEAEKEESE